MDVVSHALDGPIDRVEGGGRGYSLAREAGGYSEACSCHPKWELVFNWAADPRGLANCSRVWNT